MTGSSSSSIPRRKRPLDVPHAPASHPSQSGSPPRSRPRKGAGPSTGQTSGAGSPPEAQVDDVDPGNHPPVEPKGTLSLCMTLGVDFPEQLAAIRTKLLTLIARIYPSATMTANDEFEPSAQWRDDFERYLTGEPAIKPDGGASVLEAKLFQILSLGGSESDPVRVEELFLDEGQHLRPSAPLPDSQDNQITDHFVGHCKRVAAGLLGLKIMGNRLMRWEDVQTLLFPPRGSPAKSRTTISKYIQKFKSGGHLLSGDSLNGYKIVRYETTHKSSVDRKFFYQLQAPW